jgi:hypothetical protein
MKDTDFLRYSGPYDLMYDAVPRIADALDEWKCSVTLNVYGIDLVRVIELDEEGDRKKYVDPLYVFVEKGKNTPAPRNLHRLGTVVKVCELLQTGEIDMDAALSYGVDTSQETPDTGTDNTEPTGAEQTTPGDNG